MFFELLKSDPRKKIKFLAEYAVFEVTSHGGVQAHPPALARDSVVNVSSIKLQSGFANSISCPYCHVNSKVEAILP